MSVAASLRTRLLGYSSLAALLNDRIVAGVADQGIDVPRLLIQRISDAPIAQTFDENLSDAAIEPVLRVGRWQVTIYALTYDEVEQVSALVSRRLHNWGGDGLVRQVVQLGAQDLGREVTANQISRSLDFQVTEVWA